MLLDMIFVKLKRDRTCSCFEGQKQATTDAPIRRRDGRFAVDWLAGWNAQGISSPFASARLQCNDELRKDRITFD